MGLWPFSASYIRARFRSFTQLGSRHVHQKEGKKVRRGIIHQSVHEVKTPTIHAAGISCLKHLIGSSQLISKEGLECSASTLQFEGMGVQPCSELEKVCAHQICQQTKKLMPHTPYFQDHDYAYCCHCQYRRTSVRLSAPKAHPSSISSPRLQR